MRDNIALTAKKLAWRFLPMPVVVRASYWRQHFLAGEWEETQLRSILPVAGLALDVGANVGVYSYALMRLGHEVVSFEPDPHFQRRLRALLGARAHVETVALSSVSGDGRMRVPKMGAVYGGSNASVSERAVPDSEIATTYPVSLRTLDSYGFNQVVFIKIDVEGYEEEVLAGAMDTIRRCRPVLLIEIEERHNSGGLARINSSLTALNYRGFFYHNRKWHPLDEFVREIHQANLPSADLKNRRSLDYVNNFIFQDANIEGIGGTEARKDPLAP